MPHPELRWLYVPDVGHLLVLADDWNRANKTYRILDLSLERTVRGVPVPVGRVPDAALLQPRAYPKTLLGEWRKQAWARWRTERELRADRLRRDGPAPWNKNEFLKLGLDEERQAAARRRREATRAYDNYRGHR